ncbi:hypothetical protein POM88_043766 [Heracleum sosnowskyi]|uniref:Uncharacterized protein n=1 Tax=Heracleum sosnowskyi TaxID=360622 RepID=A0AAD8H433_9APIA|nr:hypothetical protein POM88_043764 [Heracleum sosnowskyi]KAK1359292.1 hypothetical protein POM88_043766 [Heracleum sosnowskyi]
MKGIIKFISLLVFLTFFLCSTDADTCDPIITQKLTGRKIRNEPQWEVLIKPTCWCQYSNATLACTGFKTVEPLDSNVITRTSADVCSIVNSFYIESPPTFTYAWRKPYNFTKISYAIACS